MEEVQKIILHYKDVDFEKEVSTFEGLVAFSTAFYKDVSEIYDVVTRVKNTERNPTGFGFNDAAILGLLVRIWKILKEIVVYYEKNNADIISLLDRQVIEAAVTAKYLLINGDEAIVDYRKCSYKDRINMIRDSKKNPEFWQTKPGQRLMKSIMDKLDAEGWDINSFEDQKKNRWKLQGKNFYKIFAEIEPEEFYKYLYGIPSEGIHGSWNDSMDYHLQKNDDGTFSVYPFYQEVDIRFVTPILKLCHDPYVMWLKRIDAEDEYLLKALEWTRRMNLKLYKSFEIAYEVYEAKIKSA
jgi:hypothetical protein